MVSWPQTFCQVPRNTKPPQWLTQRAAICEAVYHWNWSAMIAVLTTRSPHKTRLLIQIPWANAGKPLQKLVASCYHVPSACCTTKLAGNHRVGTFYGTCTQYSIVRRSSGCTISSDISQLIILLIDEVQQLHLSLLPEDHANIKGRLPCHQLNFQTVSLQRGIQNGWAKITFSPNLFCVASSEAFPAATQRKQNTT